MKNNGDQNHSSNGFLLGIIIGGVLVALFTTQKGRQLLRELSEKGLDALETVEEKAKKINLEDPLTEVYEEEAKDADIPLASPAQVEKEIEEAQTAAEDPKHPETQHKVRRFFKKKK